MGKRIKGRKREQVLLRLERSGLSIAEFCRRQELSYGTVMRWRRESRPGEVVTKQQAAFVEVALDEDEGQKLQRGKGSALCAELSLPDGAVLRVYRSSADPKA